MQFLKTFFAWLFPKKHPLISLIAASRGRLPLLAKFLHSAFYNASSPDQVEVILVTDNDDRETANFLKNWKKHHGTCNLMVLRRLRSSNINRDYVNYGAVKASGKYVWGLGNDVEIDQKNYDKAIEQEIEGFLRDKPDRLVYVFVKDDVNGGEMNGRFSSFPIFTKEVVDTIQAIMPNEITGWGADGVCFGIWKNLICDRIYVSGTIKLIHYCHHNGRMERDEISHNMQKCSSNTALHKEDAQKYINKLNNRILEYAAKI